ncbi:unnamed protein product [Caretta caretta]
MGNAESVPAGSASRLSVSQSPGIRFGECNRSVERGSPPECPVLAMRPPQLPLQASRAGVWCWAPGDRGVRALAIIAQDPRVLPDPPSEIQTAVHIKALCQSKLTQTGKA